MNVQGKPRLFTSSIMKNPNLKDLRDNPKKFVEKLGYMPIFKVSTYRTE